MYLIRLPILLSHQQKFVYFLRRGWNFAFGVLATRHRQNSFSLLMAKLRPEFAASFLLSTVPKFYNKNVIYLFVCLWLHFIRKVISLHIVGNDKKENFKMFFIVYCWCECLLWYSASLKRHNKIIVQLYEFSIYTNQLIMHSLVY